MLQRVLPCVAERCSVLQRVLQCVLVMRSWIPEGAQLCVLQLCAVCWSAL